MSKLRIILYILLSLIFLELFQFINLVDIYKYQVDSVIFEIETQNSLTAPEKQKQLDSVDQIRQDIINKKKNLLIYLLTTTSVFIITSIIYYKNKGYFISKNLTDDKSKWTGYAVLDSLLEVELFPHQLKVYR